jgi:diguanylate cyclase (GGDEF)-like protein
MRELTEPIPPGEVAPKGGRLAFVAVALGVPAFLTITRNDPALSDRVALGAIVLALTIAATWRVSRALRAHARSEADLAYQATHDSLTQLPNRVAAEAHLARALIADVRPGAQVALLFLDLDRFKLLNDTMGHNAGDELLVAVAGRLRRRVGATDLVARVGGDEFVVVRNEVDDLADVLAVCEQLRDALASPFALRGGEVFTSVSIGVALSERGHGSVGAEALIREADTAMYQAKDAGRNQMAVYDGSMRDRLIERVTLDNDLRLASERDELYLQYQPVIRLPAGPIEGVEALIRWAHPINGIIPPSKFIPIAEESTAIMRIGAWVLEQACRQLAVWRRTIDLPPDFYVSVNLSARQVHDPDLISTVQRVLRENELPPSALSLELTESILMEEPERSRTRLQALRELGVRLAIDDFGTGYSSLAYVQRFPTQTVKIDRSFVEALDDADTSQESLVAAIVAMAAALGMTTVAEGIETAAQEARLIQLGCQAAQGFFYSEPVSADEIAFTVRRLSAPAPPVRD